MYFFKKTQISSFKEKTQKIFKWLRKSISEKEMIKTFNCGVGFCIIINQKKYEKVKKYFSNNFKPFVIGKVVNGKKNIELNGKIRW